MSDGLPPDSVPAWAAIGTAIGAALGAFGLWLANRMLGKAAFQTAINAGFKELTDQLQEERDFFRRQLTAERIAWSAERSDFTGQIRDLRQSIESLKALLRRNGVEVPDHHMAVRDFTVLPGKDEG